MAYSLQRLVSEQILSNTSIDKLPINIYNIISDTLCLPYVQDLPCYRKVLKGWCEYKYILSMLRCLNRLNKSILLLAACKLRDMRIISDILNSDIVIDMFKDDIAVQLIHMQDIERIKLFFSKVSIIYNKSIIKALAKVNNHEIFEYMLGIPNNRIHEDDIIFHGNYDMVLIYDKLIGWNYPRDVISYSSRIDMFNHFKTKYDIDVTSDMVEQSIRYMYAEDGAKLAKEYGINITIDMVLCIYEWSKKIGRSYILYLDSINLLSNDPTITIPKLIRKIAKLNDVYMVEYLYCKYIINHSEKQQLKNMLYCDEYNDAIIKLHMLISYI